MARFPYFGFTFQHPYYRYHNTYNKFNNSQYHEPKKNNITKQNTEEDTSSVQAKNSFSFNFTGFSDSNNPVIELLGIKLYLDDIIILCLLFLLYKEGIKDEMLFIALVLLLLS